MQPKGPSPVTPDDLQKFAKAPLRFMFLASKGHRYLWWIMFGIQLIASLIALLPAYILGGLAEKLQSGNLPLFIALSGIALYFFCGIIQEMLFSVTEYMDNLRRIRTSQRARLLLLDNTMGQSYDYFTRNLSGQIAGRISQVGDSLCNMGWSFIALAGCAGFRIVGVFAVLLTIHWQLALLFGFWALLFYWRMSVKMSLVCHYNEDVSKTSSTSCGQIVDLISNFPSFFSDGAPAHERNRIEGFIEKEVRSTGLMAGGEFSLAQTQKGWYGILGIFLLIGSAWLVSQNQITIPQLYMLLGLWGAISGFGWVSWAIGQLLWNYAKATEQLSGLLEPYTVLEPAHPMALPKGAPEIHYAGVSFTYPKAGIVFDNLELTIPAGQHIGLVGRSGAGKSTFVSLLLRHYDVSAGAVTVAGVPLPQLCRGDLRRMASVVPQDPSLFHRSVLDNVRFVRPEATLDEVRRACQLAHADEFIETLPQKYDSLVGERGIKLSVGQRQRVAIARAILKDAPLVIFDEATSALDSESEAAIQEAIATQFKGKTLLVIAHRLSTLRQMDRIIVLDKGRIVQDGTPSELLARDGIFRHLWELQSEGFLADKSTPPFESHEESEN